LSNPAARGRSSFALSYFALFAIYGVASPYLQILLRGLGYGPAAVGLFSGLFEVVGIAGPLVIARLADASGRFKPALFACAALACLPLAPLVLLHSPAATLLCLALLALGLRSMVPIMDAATVAMTSAGRGWDYGRIRAVGSAGFVSIALILQLIPGFDHGPPANIAIWIASIAAIFGLSLIPLPEAGKGGRRQGEVAAGIAVARIVRPRITPSGVGRESSACSGFSWPFILGLAIIALGRLAMSPVNSFFSLYLLDEVKWNAVGGMWALAALSEIPLMMLSGRIVARLGPLRANALGTGAIALRLAIYVLFPCPLGIVAAQLLHSLCFGLLHPAGVAFVALMVRPERRAQGMAAYIGLGVGLPAFAGSALGGLVVQGWGYRALFGSFIAFALLSLLLFASTRKKFAAA
jgi:MFS transporter, PPP family, 3-phenylpropionic acid transporter